MGNIPLKCVKERVYDKVTDLLVQKKKKLTYPGQYEVYGPRTIKRAGTFYYRVQWVDCWRYFILTSISRPTL